MNSKIQRQLKKLERQENRILNKEGSNFIKSKVSPVKDKIQEKIPAGLKDTLDAAFYKGFQLVFEKGTDYIEKTYNKNQMQLEHDLNDYALKKNINRKYLKKLDKGAKSTKRINTSLSVLEGTVLGALGIGLPDIPLFISVIMRTIYQISLNYGYDYKRNEEKIYMLQIICASITSGIEQKIWNEKADILAQNIKNKFTIEDDLEEMIEITAKRLSDALLTAKFIQGIPVIGAIGGVVNFTIIQKIGKYAGIKYKKRYLLSSI